MNKISLLIISLLISVYAGTPNGISITNKIVPTDSADVFPTHNDLWGQGGFREVLNTTVRDAIPSARRTTGMLVYCTADSTTYQLRGDTTNASWQIYKLGKAMPDSSVISQHSVQSDTALHIDNRYLSIHGTADTSIKAQRSVFADSGTNSHKADTSIKSQRSVFADSSKNTYKSDTSIVCQRSVFADSTPKSQHAIQATKADSATVVSNLFKTPTSTRADSAVKSHIADTVLHAKDTIRACYKADTSRFSAYATKTDSARASHISDTALHSKDTVRASGKSDTVLKYINLYLGLHGTADTTPKAQHAIISTRSDSATVVSNLFKIPTATLADSAKGAHHLNGGICNADTVNCHGVVVQKNGLVGIGTTAPINKLDVRASSGACIVHAENTDVSAFTGFTANSTGTGGAGAAYLGLTNSSGDVGLVYLANSASGSAYYATPRVLVIGASTGVPIYINTNGTASHGLSIATTGYVGVGTTAPTSKLQVVGLPTYATNALAIAGGLTVGAFYILTGTNALQVVQ